MRFIAIIFLSFAFSSCAQVPSISESTNAIVHLKPDAQWREATIYRWNCGSGRRGDVRWIPEHQAYELRSAVKPEIRIWIKESEVAWIALADGTIWKDYRKKKNQNNRLNPISGS